MLLEPRVILGTLDGEIQRDFQTMIGGSFYQITEIFTTAQLRMDGFMAPILAADCIRAARIIRACGQRVVRPLAVGTADRMNRREIQHVEAHVANNRQTRVDIVERTVACRIVGHRTGKQLVPTGELRQLTLDIQRELDAAAQEGLIVGQLHQAGGFAVQQQRDLLVFIALFKLAQQTFDLLTLLVLAALGGVHQMNAALFQFQIDRNARAELLLQLITIAAELIDPGFEAKHMTADRGRGEFTDPAVIAQLAHWRAVPVFFVGSTPADIDRHLVVPIGIDLAGHGNRLPDDRLGRKQATVNHRQRVFNHDAG